MEVPGPPRLHALSLLYESGRFGLGAFRPRASGSFSFQLLMAFILFGRPGSISALYADFVAHVVDARASLCDVLCHTLKLSVVYGSGECYFPIRYLHLDFA